ncbi:MAG TPA: universal stress protein [Ktedonobacteraceae bacterium]|nr:universal stress protein [Ktedonobacteraceae bacterium]
MYKRIMVPLDGSERAEKALPVAARIARASSGIVILAQVAALPVTYTSYTMAAYAGDAIDEELHSIESYLNDLSKRGVLQGVKTETKVLFGSAAPTLLSIATSCNADLIVMTSHGRTGLKRWVLGSVAQKIARTSPVPVLVLRENGIMPVTSAAGSRALRALVTLDGSVIAKAALEPAAYLVSALSAPGKGELHLLRVVKPPTHLSLPADVSLETWKQQALHKAKAYMTSVVEHLREGPLAALHLVITWSVVMDDDVAGAIVRFAESGEDAEGAGMSTRCDLLAMATHGYTGLQYWVLGSITERVLGSTRVPMLVVRPSEMPTPKYVVDGTSMSFEETVLTNR